MTIFIINQSTDHPLNYSINHLLHKISENNDKCPPQPPKIQSDVSKRPTVSVQNPETFRPTWCKNKKKVENLWKQHHPPFLHEKSPCDQSIIKNSDHFSVNQPVD